MNGFDAYSHALASMGGFAILMLVLSAVSTIGRSPENRTESGAVKRNYDDVVYRRGRAFANAMEIAGPFFGAAAAAVLAGASPLWVNILASVFLLSRLAMAAVHIGTTLQTARSAFWAIGTLCVLGLAVLAIGGALS